MVQLSFMEEVRDKASRLIPTPYMEIVEEATAPQLSIPMYEHVMFLCDTANSKPNIVDDVVRALRRRINDDNPAVKHLLVLLLDAMMKNCGSPFHVEVCSQKGLLRDLVNLAADPPHSARGMQAKEAALTLVLNLSIWFAGHPDPNCHILTTLANDVRSISGPNAFEGIRPDVNTHIQMTIPANPRAGHHDHQQQQQQQQQQRRGGAASAGNKSQKDRRNYVNAILVDLPTESTLAGMLDSCVAFSEYLSNAQRTPEGDLVFDDIISSFASKVGKDHDYVTILLSSNLQIDRDVLRSVSDSQFAVLARLDAKPQGDATTGGAAGAEAAPAAPAGGDQQVHLPSNVAGLSTNTPVVVTSAASVTPPKAVVPAAAPPDMDDLFGAPTPVAVPASSPAVVSTETLAPVDYFAVAPVHSPEAAPDEEKESEEEEAPAPTPHPSMPPNAQVIDHSEGGSSIWAAVSANPPCIPAPEEPAAEDAAPASAPETVEVAGDDKDNADQSVVDAVPTGTPAVSPAEEEEEEKAEETAPDADDAPAPAAMNADDDDDFDAFLEGNLTK